MTHPQGSDSKYWPDGVRPPQPTDTVVVTLAEWRALRAFLSQLSVMQKRGVATYLRDSAGGPPELRAAAADIVEHGA